MKAWLNDSLIEADLPALSVYDRGLTLGDGLFETIRVARGSPRHLKRHFARLRTGSTILGIPLPFGDQALAEAIASVLKVNAVTGGSARVTLTRGPAARGVLPSPSPTPTVLITCAAATPMPPSVGAIIAATVRRNEHSPLARIKSLNYLDNVMARMEADRCGAGEAILLNSGGRVAEASVANVFALVGGRLVTPPVDDGALPGIARGLILAAGEAVEGSLSVEDLQQAEAIILTSSLGLRTLEALGGKPRATASSQTLIHRLWAIIDTPDTTL